MTITSAVETIDPAMAQALLDAVPEDGIHRNVRGVKVVNFAGDIARGKWKINGEAIKIDSNGKLSDGVHRMQAVILADTPIETLVVRGVDPETRITMDTGTARTLADNLKFMGERDYTILASAVNVTWCRSVGEYLRQGSPSHQMAFEILEANPGLRDSSVIIAEQMKAVRASKGLCAALHYEMTKVDAANAEVFWRRLGIGIDLKEEDDPIFLLRRRLMNQKKDASLRLSFGMVHALTIKAWNHYMIGGPIQSLRWRSGGAKPEPFPQIGDTYRND